MRRRIGLIVLIVSMLAAVTPAGGQSVPAAGPPFPDGEWVGRFQSRSTTPTGSASTVIDFTVETEEGAGRSGEVTGYSATTQNRATDEEFFTVATATVIDHTLGLEVNTAPPTLSGQATWRWELETNSPLGASELPDETLPQSWVMQPRAVSCASVSARSGGTNGDTQFSTDLIALRQGEDETVAPLLAQMAVIEEQLAAGDMESAEAIVLLLGLVGLAQAHNDALAGLTECQLAIPGLSLIDPLRALIEPLIHKLLGVITSTPPGILHPQFLIDVLFAAFESGALGPFAIDQPLADFFEIAIENALIPAVETAVQNFDVATLQDLIHAGAMFGMPLLLDAATFALTELLSAPQGTLP